MTATIATAMPVGKDWSHEVKWDGYRALLVNDGKHVRLVSRNLKDLTADYPQVAKALAKVTTHPVMLDGEIVALDEPASRRSRLSSTAAPVARWWCFMPSTSCTVRSRLLRQATPGAASDTSGLTFAAPILLSSPLPGTPERIEHAVRDAGLEGVVAKRTGSTYHPGIRSRNWLKVKFAKRQEFVIGGYKPAGDTFDSVLVGYYQERKFYYAGKVRAGFTPRTRVEVWSRIEDLNVPLCPFVNLPNSVGKSHWGEGVTVEDMKVLRWVKPKVIIEVAFTEWTAGGNLRHASFEGMREDKIARQVGRLA
jgi:bifunctional non-homologous end joining protein LigD